ncbi:MAG: hypothetical protein ACRDTA_14750 [Pseudonocardiaceae bacterium]
MASNAFVVVIANVSPSAVGGHLPTLAKLGASGSHPRERTTAGRCACQVRVSPPAGCYGVPLVARRPSDPVLDYDNQRGTELATLGRPDPHSVLVEGTLT